MPTIDEYIAGLDRKEKQANLVSSNIGEAANINPDDFAANAKLARSLKMANDAVYENKDFARSQNLIKETNVPQLIDNNPQTSKFLINQDNAKIAADDINNLKQFEKSYGEIKNREFSTFKDPFSYTLGDFYNSELFHNLTNSLTRGYKKFKEITGVMSTDHSLAEKINKQTNGLFFSNTLEKQKERAYEANGMYYNQAAERAVYINSLQRDVEAYRSSERVEEQRAALNKTKTFGEAATYIANNPAAAVDATLESVGTYAPVAAASLVAAPLTAASAVTSFFTTAALRRAAVTFAGSFGLEYGSVIDEAIVNNGGNPSKVDDIYKAITNKKLMEEAKEKAVKRGVTVGFFDAVTAGLAGKLLSKAKPTLSSVAPRVAGEGALQMGGGAAGEATAQYVTNEEFNPSAILLEAIGELPTALTEVPGNYKNTMEDAQRAEAVGNVIADMNQLSAASKVRARDSDTFKQWVDQVTEDNPIQNVYINSNTLKQAGLDKELAKVSPEMAAKVEAASMSNSDVEISISDYMTQIAPTPLGDAMINDLRAEGETMTRKEAAQFIENKAQEMQIASEQMMKQKEQDQIFIDSAKQVETNIFNQLKSTNVYSNTASKSFATYVRDIYVTKAAEMGITPTELYSMVPYGITANIPTPDVQLFNQNGETMMGINVRNDSKAGIRYADEIISGNKKYETRDTDSLRPYVGKRIGIVRTGEGAAKAIGEVTLGEPLVVNEQQFNEMRDQHLVPAGSTFDVKEGGVKYLYPITNPIKFDTEKDVGKGIVARQVLNQGKDKTKGDVTQHVLNAERGKRVMGTVAEISDKENKIINDAANKLKIDSNELLTTVKNHKLAHPEFDGWASLELTKIKIEPAKKDKPAKYEFEYKTVPYTFANGQNGKVMKTDDPEYGTRVKALGKKIHDEVRKIFKRAKTGDKAAQNIIRQAGWYKEMRSRLRQEFGGLGDVFADLLGATSPNTPVRENWKNAVDILRRATRGDFDEMMPKWVEWSSKVDDAEIKFAAWFAEQMKLGKTKVEVKDPFGFEKWVKDQKSTGLTKEQIEATDEFKEKLEEYKSTDYQKKLAELSALRDLPDELLPLKETGKKYGFNGRNGVRALTNLWRVVKDPNADIAVGGTAPKALNFSGNLIGFRERATIDVWAARLLQRLSGGLRIPSMAEGGVTGNMLSTGQTTMQFGFGQDVFTEAVKLIRSDKTMKSEERLSKINDDDLQAIVWFLEKEVWTKNNWTSAAGEGGSFEQEADLTGQADLEQVTQLRKIMDSSKSTPEQKAAAADQLNSIARTVDRFTGGLSIQQALDTQGIDFVPSDADMARLGEDIRLSVYESDNGATVLGSKSLTTQGVYGTPERSLDLEIIARQGYDVNPVWLKMLQEALAANQDSVFLSKVLRHDEVVDYSKHRPGVEIYFKDAGSLNKIQPILDQLAANGVEFYTVIVDGKRSPEAMAGEMPDAVGVRFQFVPEMIERYSDEPQWSNLTVEEISTKIQEQGKELVKLANEISRQVQGVSFAGQFWYETEVAFKNQYQEKIDAITTRDTKGKRGDARSGGWRGESILEGVKNANNWARESQLQSGTEDQSGGELLNQLTAPTTDARTGLPLNPDGTVTLYHHTNAGAAEQIKRSGQLISAAEPDVYLTTSREADIGYGDTVVAVRVNPDRLNIDDEFPNGRQDYRISVGQNGAFQVTVGEYKSVLEQPSRGGYNPKSLTTILTKESDYSTFLHETSHFYLDMLTRLAEMPNAPESFKNDLNTVIEWSGATPEQWAAWDAEYRTTGNMNEGMRKVHEAFAYNSEIYIATGEAPSVKMQSMFDMFVVWLRRVYKSIRDELNAIYRQEFNEDLPILTGEVRQVMDRMLASEELIIQAQEVRNMVPIYQTQEQSGMDDSTWAAYQALAQESQNAGIASLTEVSLRQMRWLSNAKSRLFKEQQKQTAEIRKEVKAQVAKEIEKQPIYSALRLIKNGEIVNDDGTVIKLEENTKLSVAGMEELYMGEGDKYALLDWSKLGYGKYGMLSNEGMHPDVLAERTGFQSGDQLVRALIVAPSLKEAVELETDKRMLEQYSELSDPRAMEIAVERALHNEARARFVAAELRHAAKATQPVRLMLQAAKQAARRIVGDKLIRNVKVSEYSVAEMRSTKAAEKAMKEGKPEEVTKQLQNRLLNNQLASEATTAIQDIDKGIRYLKMVQTDQSRKRVGADYSDQIDQMLARFDLNNRSLKSIDEQTSLLKWMEAQLANGYEPEIPLNLQNPDYRKNYKNMTVNEFRDLVDAVKEIEFMGRSEQNLLTALKETAYKLARDEIVGSINANANGRIANARTPTNNMARSLQSVKKYGAAHFKVATIALVLDGGKEGPMWEYFIRTANKAGDKETQMRADATEKLSEIFQPILKEKMGGKGIYFEGIATTQDRREGKTGSNFNKEARIAIAMNMGNEGNIQRLLDGEGWTMSQVMPILNSLTKDELFAIQKIWDYFETFRPAIAAKERRVYGKEPQWIEPKSITIKSSDGETVTLRGGYYPIKYDPQASAQAESNDEKEQAKRDMAGAFTSATTRRSFTKNRAEKVKDRPLIYTLAAMYSGINDVVHDLAWHEWLIDANKLMRSNTIDSAIRNQYGPQYVQEIKSWIKDNAAGEVGSEGGVDIALNFLRQNVSAAGLAFNVVSAAMQLTGFNQSIDKVGLKYIGVGVGKTMINPIKTTKKVYAKSTFMANRSRTQFRELNELRNQIQDESGVMRNIRLGSYFLMMQMQRVVDVPTWLGAYEKAIVEGNDEQRSRDLADQAVIDSQGGGMLKDLSRAERGGAVQKAFSVYYSYMNTYFNRMAVATMTEKSKGKLAARYLLLTLVPVALGHAIRSALTPSGDDDEEFDAIKLSKELAQESLSYLLGSMVILREFADASKILFGAEKPRDYSGPQGLRAVADSYALLKQAVQLEFDDSFRKTAINVIGDFTALPSAQANRTITGTQALIEGETENPAAVVFGFKK